MSAKSVSSGLGKVVKEALGYIQKPPTDDKKIQHLRIFLQDGCDEIVVECFQKYGSWDVTKQKFENIPQWDILIQNLRKLLPVQADALPEQKTSPVQMNLKRKSSSDVKGSHAKRANLGGTASDSSACASGDKTDEFFAHSGITTESESDESDDIDSTDNDPTDDLLTHASTDDFQQDQNMSTREVVDSVTGIWRQAGLSETFDIEKFVKSVDEDIVRNQGKRLKYHQIREQLAGGKTQVGKTAFKALLGLLAKKRNVVTVVVTTTLDVRDKLATDLQENYFNKMPEDSRPDCMTITIQMGSSIKKNEFDEALNKCMRSYGVVVVNCTKHAIEKVGKRIAELRGTKTIRDFVLVKDESDTMDRTEDGALGLERALDFLTGKKDINHAGRLASPLMILNISATLLPIFLRIRSEHGNVVESHFGHPSPDDYSGLDNMQPIGGEYLVDKELRRKNEPVSYWSDRVANLYADAHSDQKRGVLLLDAVNPRVTAGDNIQDRAEHIQSEYPRFHVVIVWGSGGVKIRLAGHKKWLADGELVSFVRDCFSTKRMVRDGRVEELCGSERRLPISRVLSAIVCHSGLDHPIAVVGYSRLLRGDSFRSSCVKTLNNTGEMAVVPTHMLCVPGETQSLENLVQMIGRATGTFKRILTDNGHSKVTVLTHWRDWDAARAYYEFQRQLAERIPTEGLQVALSNIAAEYSKDADIRNRGSRPIGAKKRKLKVETPFAQGPPGTGASWADLHGYGCYNRHGRFFRLDSPIPPQERAQMSPKQLAIEEHLYHRKYDSDVFSIAVRTALRKWGISDSFHPVADWRDLFSSIPYVSYSREGGVSVKTRTKIWSTACATGQAGSWTLKYFDGPILQRHGRVGGRRGDFLRLNEDILKFWDKFRVHIEKKLPLCERKELEGVIVNF